MSKEDELWKQLKAMGRFSRREAFEKYKELGGVSNSVLGVYLIVWMHKGVLKHDKESGVFVVEPSRESTQKVRCDMCGFQLRVAKRPSTKTGLGEILFCPRCGAEYRDGKFVRIEERWKSTNLSLYE